MLPPPPRSTLFPYTTLFRSANPSYTEARESRLNIIVAGTEGGIVMVEAGAQQASEDDVIGAIEFGHQCCRKMGAVINDIVKKIGKAKRAFSSPPIDQALYDQISKQFRKDLADALNTQKYPKLESYSKVAELKKKILEPLPEEKQEEAAKLYDLLKE